MASGGRLEAGGLGLGPGHAHLPGVVLGRPVLPAHEELTPAADAPLREQRLYGVDVRAERRDGSWVEDGLGVEVLADAGLAPPLARALAPLVVGEARRAQLLAAAGALLEHVRLLQPRVLQRRRCCLRRQLATLRRRRCCRRREGLDPLPVARARRERGRPVGPVDSRCIPRAEHVAVRALLATAGGATVHRVERRAAHAIVLGTEEHVDRVGPRHAQKRRRACAAAVARVELLEAHPHALVGRTGRLEPVQQRRGRLALGHPAQLLHLRRRRGGRRQHGAVCRDARRESDESLGILEPHELAHSHQLVLAPRRARHLVQVRAASHLDGHHLHQPCRHARRLRPSAVGGAVARQRAHQRRLLVDAPHVLGGAVLGEGHRLAPGGDLRRRGRGILRHAALSLCRRRLRRVRPVEGGGALGVGAAGGALGVGARAGRGRGGAHGRRQQLRR
eukprot:scaffold14121_cov67-Phaeocystis_antarctica.AAC.5